jgi:hypothetical protein|nr:MAG TPA: protein of unknown function (DUF5338) [Caudoviricetes sp.]DAT80785.1 MAG TPA: protein of unknown function (DUF5338) [Caudoviricetes sp.]
MKTVDYVKIESLYNTRLSIQENLEVLRQKGVEVSERTLYRYCKDKGIGDRLSDEELRHLINPRQTIMQNLETIKGQGYKISKDRISKVLKESSLSRPSDDEGQVKTEILTTPKPTLNDIVGLDKFLSSLNPNINEEWQGKETKEEVWQEKDKVIGNDWQKDTEPVVDEVKPTVQEDTNPLCNLKFDFAKLMGDF